ncbi:MAG: tyrosine recombinase XerC [Clostridia bacterium]|nr:tyrosine recombinase XerC [Clostridia bacterium]MBQ8382881.1 tyrosine recombinase XerC [Clostridia bacterium]
MREYPPIFHEFANYKLAIQNRSKLTVEQYLLDLDQFFRYYLCKQSHKRVTQEAFEAQSLDTVDLTLCGEITSYDIIEFVGWEASDRDNKPAARARKLSAIRSFYKFLTTTKHYLAENPARDVEGPRVKQALPKFLTLDESILLLDTIKGDTRSKTGKRDYCMVTLFLNCGMRLSELVGISLGDIDPDLRSMRVVGKGNKERMIYLNDACREAITDWLKVRATLEIKEKNALFVSSRGTRISKQMVQTVVYKYLDMAGLGNRKLSTHKLRHTAATLMYQEGGVDVRVLKDILGHAQLNTTQIYTHVSNEQMEEAMAKNPLAKKKK